MKNMIKRLVALLVVMSTMSVTVACGGGPGSPTAPSALMVPLVASAPMSTASIVFHYAQLFSALPAGQSFGIKMTQKVDGKVEDISVSSGTVEVKMTSQPDGELSIWLAIIEPTNVVSNVSVKTSVQVINGVGNISIPIIAKTNYIRFVNGSIPFTNGVAEVSVLR